MDIQDFLDAESERRRQETLKDSPQLTLGEVTIHLENVAEPEKPVVFDDDSYRPTTVGSWRGKYDELAIRFEENDEENQTETSQFLRELKEADGSEFRGYKGGEYKMSNNTPVWIANRGNQNGFESLNQGVVGVTETEEKVVIETSEVPF